MIKSLHLIALTIVFILGFQFDAVACGNARNRINKLYESRRMAMTAARKDAGIPRNQRPEVKHVPLHDMKTKKPVIENGRVVMTREYHYKNTKGEPIIIKEHTYGHPGAASPDAGELPHFNVTWGDGRAGSVPGTKAHYNIEM